MEDVVRTSKNMNTCIEGQSSNNSSRSATPLTWFHKCYLQLPLLIYYDFVWSIYTFKRRYIQKFTCIPGYFVHKNVTSLTKHVLNCTTCRANADLETRS